MRTETKYYECVGIKDDTLYMLDYIFVDSEDFKGATGTVFAPLTQGQIDERNEPEYVKESYRDFWVEAVKEGNTDAGLDEFIDDVLGDNLFPGYDGSYVDKIPDSIREKYFPGAVTFECVGGGRCFDVDMQFDIVINAELITEINKVEIKAA